MADETNVPPTNEDVDASTPPAPENEPDTEPSLKPPKKEDNKPPDDEIDYKAAYQREKAIRDELQSKIGQKEKEMKALMTEEQIKAKEAAEAAEEKERLLKQYQDREAIANLKIGLLGKGFSEINASEAADAMHSGDFEKVIELVGKHVDEKIKQLELEKKEKESKQTEKDPFADQLAKYKDRKRFRY